MFFLSIIFFQLIFSLSPKNQLSVIESMLKRDTDFEVFAEHIQSIGSIDSGSPIELILTNQYTTREVFCHVGDEVPSDHPLYCFSEKSLKNSKKTTMSTGLLWRENAINEYVGGLNPGDLIVVYLDPNRNLMGSSQKTEGLNQDTSLRMVYLGNGKVLVKLTDKGGFYVYPLSYFEKMRGEEIDKHIFRQIDRLEIWTQQSYLSGQQYENIKWCLDNKAKLQNIYRTWYAYWASHSYYSVPFKKQFHYSQKETSYVDFLKKSLSQSQVWEQPKQSYAPAVLQLLSPPYTVRGSSFMMNCHHLALGSIASNLASYFHDEVSQKMGLTDSRFNEDWLSSLVAGDVITLFEDSVSRRDIEESGAVHSVLCIGNGKFIEKKGDIGHFDYPTPKQIWNNFQRGNKMTIHSTIDKSKFYVGLSNNRSYAFDKDSLDESFDRAYPYILQHLKELNQLWKIWYQSQIDNELPNHFLKLLIQNRVEILRELDGHASELELNQVQTSFCKGEERREKIVEQLSQRDDFLKNEILKPILTKYIFTESGEYPTVLIDEQKEYLEKILEHYRDNEKEEGLYFINEILYYTIFYFIPEGQVIPEFLREFIESLDRKAQNLFEGYAPFLEKSFKKGQPFLSSQVKEYHNQLGIIHQRVQEQITNIIIYEQREIVRLSSFEEILEKAKSGDKFSEIEFRYAVMSDLLKQASILELIGIQYVFIRGHFIPCKMLKKLTKNDDIESRVIQVNDKVIVDKKRPGGRQAVTNLSELTKVSHPFIVSPICASLTEYLSFCTVYPFVEGKLLYTHYMKEGQQNQNNRLCDWSEREQKEFFLSLLLALEECSFNGFFHNDLHSNSILVSNKGLASLIDFEYADKSVRDRTQEFIILEEAYPFYNDAFKLMLILVEMKSSWSNQLLEVFFEEGKHPINRADTIREFEKASCNFSSLQSNQGLKDIYNQMKSDMYTDIKLFNVFLQDLIKDEYFEGLLDGIKNKVSLPISQLDRLKSVRSSHLKKKERVRKELDSSLKVQKQSKKDSYSHSVEVKQKSVKESAFKRNTLKQWHRNKLNLFIKVRKSA